MASVGKCRCEGREFEIHSNAHVKAGAAILYQNPGPTGSPPALLVNEADVGTLEVGMELETRRRCVVTITELK